VHVACCRSDGVGGRICNLRVPPDSGDENGCTNRVVPNGGLACDVGIPSWHGCPSPRLRGRDELARSLLMCAAGVAAPSGCHRPSAGCPSATRHCRDAHSGPPGESRSGSLHSNAQGWMDGLCVVRRVVRWSQLRVQTARTGSRQRAHNVVGCTALGIVWCTSGVRCVVVYGGGVRCVVYGRCTLCGVRCCAVLQSGRTSALDTDHELRQRRHAAFGRMAPSAFGFLPSCSVPHRSSKARSPASLSPMCKMRPWTAGGSGRGGTRVRD
jgi:hypothetical protein